MAWDLTPSLALDKPLLHSILPLTFFDTCINRFAKLRGLHSLDNMTTDPTPLIIFKPIKNFFPSYDACANVQLIFHSYAANKLIALLIRHSIRRNYFAMSHGFWCSNFKMHRLRSAPWHIYQILLP